MNKRILITGGAGFIGSHLIKKLSEEGGWEICVLDTLSDQVHDKGWPIPDDVLLFNVDIRDSEMVALALEGVTHVVHLAAETGVGQSAYEMPRYIDVNEYGTAILMSEISKLKHELTSFVLASSRAVYGNGRYFCETCGEVYPVNRPISHTSVSSWELVCPICSKSIEYQASVENQQINPASIYAITKHNQEQIIQLTAQSRSIPAVILRLQNVYGPGQSLTNPYSGILSLFGNRLLNDQPIFIYEDGLALRDFIYIDDVINSIILSLNYQSTDCEIFNVGTGVGTTVIEVANQLSKHLDKQSVIKINGQHRFGDIRHSIANPSKAKSKLGFTARHTLNDGIELFAKWLINQSPQVDNYEKMAHEMKEQCVLMGSIQ